MDDYKNKDIEIAAIHNDEGYQYLRQTYSEQYNLGSLEPNIQVYDVDLRGDRTWALRHTQHKRIPLDKSANEVMKNVARLWGFIVRMETIADDGSVIHLFECEH